MGRKERGACCSLRLPACLLWACDSHLLRKDAGHIHKRFVQLARRFRITLCRHEVGQSITEPRHSRAVVQIEGMVQ